jgi:hypothetical protein
LRRFVEQISERLDDRFRLLTGGRSAVPRQQTLLATIQWSVEQLSEDEQRLLRRLSVFAGGWTLESATAVAGNSADEFEVLDLLTRLIDKSLVLVEQSGGSEARYGMLETVRQYGQERLMEAGEAGEVRERHLAEFMRLAEGFTPKVRARRVRDPAPDDRAGQPPRGYPSSASGMTSAISSWSAPWDTSGLAARTSSKDASMSTRRWRVPRRNRYGARMRASCAALAFSPPTRATRPPRATPWRPGSRCGARLAIP